MLLAGAIIMNTFGIELDFLQVGDGERSGDAIALRYGSPLIGSEVMIVDGGNKASGEELVRHVLGVYGTRTVQHVVNTHPDGDHAGLTEVLENLDVREFMDASAVGICRWAARPICRSTLHADRSPKDAFERPSMLRTSLRRLLYGSAFLFTSRFREEISVLFASYHRIKIGI